MNELQMNNGNDFWKYLLVKWIETNFHSFVL